MSVPVSIVPFHHPEYPSEAAPSDWLRAFVFAGNLHGQDATGQHAESASFDQVLQGLRTTSESRTDLYAAVAGSPPATLPLWAGGHSADSTDTTYPLGFLEETFPLVANRQSVDASCVLDGEIAPLPGADTIDPTATATYRLLLDALVAHTRAADRRWARVWKDLPAHQSFTPYDDDELYASCGFTRVFEELCGHLPAQGSPRPLPDGYQTLSFLDDQFPDQHRAEICSLKDQFLADLPVGALAVEFEPWTPQRLTTAAEALARGSRSVTTLLLYKGVAVGMSTLTQQENGLNSVASQGSTVLTPAVRGRGLATALKSHCLAAACQRWPELETLHTSFDPYNVAIRRANEVLGFHATHRSVVWQADCS